MKVPPGMKVIPSGQLFTVGDALTGVGVPKTRHTVRKPMKSLKKSNFNQGVFIVELEKRLVCKHMPYANSGQRSAVSGQFSYQPLAKS
ncbi:MULTISPECIES: hypothetical protein [unclassified Moorena]|uniref:hypothetical protein n=1 Tax=unclassified Moorena TaxID=2683338 RepID=UPI00257D1B69|nr:MULTISPECIES: hypothetical protein [unclassified Moorena]